MSLVGYHLIGFDKNPISFTRSDHRLLQTADHRERVERFFSRTPHQFNLVFHNARLPIPDEYLKRHQHTRDALYWFMIMYGRVGGYTRWDLGWSKEQQTHIFLRGHSNFFNPDAINVVFMSNVTGPPIIPMTPHMMAHRLGHMHMLDREDRTLMKFLERWGCLVLSNYYSYTVLADECRSAKNSIDLETRLYGWGEQPHRDALWWNAIFKYLTTTRAGRKRQVNGWEYIPEWFAQYINLGKLDLLPELPEDLILAEIYNNDRALRIPVPTGTLSSPHHQRYSTQPFAHRVEQFFETVLDKWRGELIVT